MSEQERFPLYSAETRANPYPLYHRIREEEPVYWSDAVGGWHLFRYRDVMAALRDPRLSANRLEPLRHRLPEAVRAETAEMFDSLSRWALLMDPPDHTRVRKLISAAFAPRLVTRIEPRIRELVAELLDELEPRGEMDVVRDFAYPLPATIIAELLGVPPEDRDLLKHWSDDIARFMGGPRLDLDQVRQTKQSIAEMNDYFRDALKERRTQRKDDLLSALVAAQEDQDMLSEDEVLATCALVLFGGHETTTYLVSNGLLSLFRNPDQLALLRSRPELIENAIEEFMRYESPVHRLSRRALVDLEWDGKPIAAGQRVFLMVSAAGRDPEEFPDPDRLDITREGIRHLGFGYGPHFCVGAALGRLEARLAFEALLRRLPGLRPTTDTVEWQENMLLRALVALPVAW